ncbi:MAG: dinitrogenase iron-molybdenum cofactor biosynthesis protein [Ruminococcus sp.]|nr:dinitrogenase iron-molybdenum cofactor biosynthesis protein [Ruminococcus sp.]
MSRIAVATHSGELIDEHFGHAKFFRVYEISEGGYELLEVRDAVAACQHALGHDTTRFDKIIELLSDCDALFVEKIGIGAAAYLIERGVRVFEAKGSIEALLQKLSSKDI